jgi:hypothetical protein
MKTIKVEVRSGVVQEVSGVPDGVLVEIHDYDMSDDGKKYAVITYNNHGHLTEDLEYFDGVEQDEVDFELNDKIVNVMFAYTEQRLTDAQGLLIQEKYGQNLIFYGLRHTDSDMGSPATLEKNEVMVDHFGTFIATEAIDFPEGEDYVNIPLWSSTYPKLTINKDGECAVEFEEFGFCDLDIIEVAKDLNMPTTPKHLQAFIKAVAEEYDSRLGNDSASTWDIIVEDILYSVLDDLED